MNESQLAAIHIPTQSSGLPTPTHNTGGMAFGHNPFQAKQRRTAKYYQDGVSIVLPRGNNHKSVRFFMLPGGRWVEETVYRRYLSQQRKPGDPW